MEFVVNQRYQELWEELRGGHPTAPDRFYVAVAPVLVTRLIRWGKLQFPREIIEDAVTDVLLGLIQAPERFDPSKSSILGYLQMIVTRRLIDRLRRQERRQTEKIIFLEDVALAEPIANSLTEDPERVALHSGRDPALEYSPELENLMEELLPDIRDRLLATEFLAGRLSVEIFVQVYALESLPLAEQQREMKRNRDRVMLRLKRNREKLWEAIHG
ncbi:RNA polymerase sigma factor [Armatimonas rosea]|uniref:RNA polymerase sigma factor (Sigma-70 family) n=1 Tax=Armatimonas rosea TaxID=685828 RepID=A0A7W9SPF1_ARMRO|nr:sigma factor [Armatimonas rosea]MBB6050422.1 RNA polymerase sigma factor (sigma-70 family) [Armatimonas rosea]